MADMIVGNVGKVVQSEERGAREIQAENIETNGVELGSSKGSLQGKTFSEILKDSVDQTNTYQAQADTAIKELVAGRNKNIHETMLTIERADTSLKLMMQVRNKIIDAYREIMRMQV